MIRRLVGLLVAVLVASTSACEIGQDDEMAPAPRRTITATPSPHQALPGSVPVGEGEVSSADVVWAQGNQLHVGKRTVDLSPVGIDAFVVVPGGVFVLHSGELWFTDLAMLRGTGLAGVTSLAVTADGTRILVSDAEDGVPTRAYDTSTGMEVGSQGLKPESPEERLDGPDRSDVLVPQGFELAGWTGPDRFYGVATKGGRPTAVVSCELATKACTRLGPVKGPDPLVFGTGK